MEEIVSAIGIAGDIAKEFEGLELNPYHDPSGFPTIGWGHLLSRDRFGDLSQWPPITQSEAQRLLDSDLARANRAVDANIYVQLTRDQRAALIDFTFNVGSGNLQASTLRRVINREAHAQAPKEIRRWVYSAGVKLPGLVRRRDLEARFYEQGTVE